MPCCEANNHPETYCPLDIHHLLPIGTVHFRLLEGYGYADDQWTPFQAPLPQNVAEITGIQLSRDISFLQEHQFISALSRVMKHLVLCVRIYIIPHDLANVQGRLRRRDKIIVNKAGEMLRNILPQISKDPRHWDLGGPVPLKHPQQSLQQELDNRTLAELYSDLPSPQPDPSSSAPRGQLIMQRLLDEQDPDGLRCSLYNYQRRSVATMVQRELPKHDILDPVFIDLVGMDGRKFYLQPGTMEIFQERPLVAPPRGGILCEELGTGKTVMILALILATLDQSPEPEESILHNQSAVLTPLSFRHFPSSDCANARAEVSRNKGKNRASPAEHSFPTLVELLLHKARVEPKVLFCNSVSRLQHRIDNEDQLEARKLLHLYLANTPFYYQFPEPAGNIACAARRSHRNPSNMKPRVMYLSSATLIVVPNNLIGQWDREIHKHCYSGLRVLLVKTGITLPRASALASNYDIIIMTLSRFSGEAATSNRALLDLAAACACSEFEGSRVPDCQCTGHPDVSPLLQIRFLRLVLDEGHVSATMTTRLTPFAQSLSVERRWIVTGTPTTNLLGLSFGQSAQVLEDGTIGLDEDDDIPISNETGPANVYSDNIHPVRQWNHYDRGDLGKLANIIIHFLGAPQFAAEPSSFKTQITEPLLHGCGPRPGAIKVLQQVMSAVMVRHRIDHVEEDVTLPPVRQENVFLDLDTYAAKSYNAMQAAIAINAIDSERTDQDYLFHPRNVSQLLLTVENMSQLMFWSIDQSLYNVDDLVKNANVHRQTASSRGVSEDDLKLLNDSLRHLKAAASDPLWRAMQEYEDIPYRVFGLHEDIFNAWTRTRGMDSTFYSPTLVGFLHPDRLLKLRELVIRHSTTPISFLVNVGQVIAQEDRDFIRLWNAESKTKKGKDKSERLIAKQSVDNMTSPEKLAEMRKELAAALERMDTEDFDGQEQPESPSRPPKRKGFDSRASSMSPLAGVRIGSSASTKMDYILNEVLSHSSDEKFLIFSHSPLTLAHVAEGLDLIDVKYLQFTTKVLPQVREQFVMTFESSETYRVFLMELKHGARGLNLTSASRVIFCEPVWQADVESQAIKRVHRIGQTRPISVKTLAIRHTAEENMVARREALKSSGAKLPNMTEEIGMRHFIANPKFIEHKPVLTSTFDVPLLHSLSEDAVDEATTTIILDDVVLSNPHHATEYPEKEEPEPPQKKRKGVRFAD